MLKKLENFKRIKRLAIECEKIFANTYLIKDLYSNYAKNS